MSQETQRITISSSNTRNAAGTATGAQSHKERQLRIIMASNPANESLGGHTWIRDIADIHTFREAIVDSGYSLDEDFTPDFTSGDVRRALRTGRMTVYSSHPIKDGVFVTPSKMEAQGYAGEARIYSKEVILSDVAWIDGLQGQYAKVKR